MWDVGPLGNFGSAPAGGGGGGGGAASYTYSFEGIDTTSGGLAQVTYAGITFTAGRCLVCVSQAGVSSTIVSSMTVNGATATFIAASGSGTGNTTCEFWEATVGAGSGSVVVNWNALTFGSSMAGGYLANCTTFSASVAQASQSSAAGDPYAPTGSLTIPASGIGVISMIASNDFSPSPSFNYGTKDHISINTRPVQLAIGHASASGIPSFSGETGNLNTCVLAISFNP